MNELQNWLVLSHLKHTYIQNSITHTHTHARACTLNSVIYEVHTISFQTFFVWQLLLIMHTWNSSPLRTAIHLLYRPNNFWKSSCVSVSIIIVTAKVTGNKVWTIGRLRDCLDANLDQIVCDKDGVVDPIWRVLASSDRISSWIL